MKVSLTNTIELIAAFQAILFADFMLASKKTTSKSNIYISIFLLLLAINLLHDFISYFIDPISGSLSSFINLTFFLFPASLFLYNKSVLNPQFKLTKKMWHIALQLAANIVVVSFVYLENLKENPVQSPILEQITFLFYIVFYILLVGYQYSSFSLLQKNEKNSQI